MYINKKRERIHNPASTPQKRNNGLENNKTKIPIKEKPNSKPTRNKTQENTRNEQTQPLDKELRTLHHYPFTLTSRTKSSPNSRTDDYIVELKKHFGFPEKETPSHFQKFIVLSTCCSSGNEFETSTFFGWGEFGSKVVKSTTALPSAWGLAPPPPLTSEEAKTSGLVDKRFYQASPEDLSIVNTRSLQELCPQEILHRPSLKEALGQPRIFKL
uniref:Uncharacterized protein n=1 Tax=Nelumbo nucifera TaxID=4432 RepID=A0A822ZST7_NELNU|nr:TPA_asm: hypothetical protein HUJ06_004216 [Nelumbo nucifera]